MERWTVEDFNRGVNKAINGQGEAVIVQEVVDRILLCQGIRFKYLTNSGKTTFVNSDGRLLVDHTTVLDLYKID